MNKKDKNKIEKQNKRKELFYRIKRIFTLVIFITIIILFIEIQENGGGIKGIISLFLNKDASKLESLETMYVLIMGVSTDLEKELTDTIMLCAYNPKQQQAVMISIPRDTFIGDNKNNAKGSDKINSLYSESPQETLDAVSEITGLDIPYYAVINTNVLVNIVDIIGGVNFNVPIDMNYDDDTQNLHIHLKKGMQKIDGEKAEQLLRYRHSNPDKNGNMTTYPYDYGNDDYGRMRTQREFLIATIKETLQIKNVTKIKSLLKTIFDNLDTNLTVDKISEYVPYITDFNITNIDSFQLPGESIKYNNLWFFAHDEQETKELIERTKNKLEGIENIINNGNIINQNIVNN